MSTDNNAADVKAGDIAKAVDTVKPETKEVTAGDIIGDNKKAETKLVPEAVFLEEKNARKELEREVKALKASIEEGATRKEVSKSVEEMAAKYDIDKSVLSDLTDSIRRQTEADVEERISKRLKPIEDSARADAVRKAFTAHYDKALESMSEYDGIVNKEVIFRLTLDPQNANKRLSEIIEETYGSAVGGRRTMDGGGKPRGSDTSGVLDSNRLRTDEKYLDEVLANPVLKKQYDDALLEYMKR